MAKAPKICSIGVRLLAFAATLCAAIVMGTSHDSATVLNLKFDAKYSNSPAFRYFLIVNAVVSVYSLVLVFLHFKNLDWRVLVVLDLVVTVMLTSSFSAAMAVAYVGKKGNTHAGWLPVCGQVPKFCDHVTGALISGFIANILYFLLLLYSLHSVLNLFML
ncbi:Casparian strip membrane protein domain [Dillenia turbinata]|uniref:CASP-like protein n=1 Tax=Dillenia turbinata TaxID=194707 RepID=A0AAN8UVJ2_9MAGN